MSTLRKFPHFPKRKMKIRVSLLLALPITVVYGGQLIPTADGTGWRYNMTEEIGKGLDIRDAKNRRRWQDSRACFVSHRRSGER
jgi:hypothetical protein